MIFKKKSIHELKMERASQASKLKEVAERERVKEDIRQIKASKRRLAYKDYTTTASKVGKGFAHAGKGFGSIIGGVADMLGEPPKKGKKGGKKPRFDPFAGF